MKEFGLSREYRLAERSQFLKFFRQSRRYRFKDCLVYQIPNEVGHFRLGLTIKARASSVERSRIKRVVRESFRKNRLILGGYDYNVVIPKGTKLSYPYDESLRSVLMRELSDVIHD